MPHGASKIEEINEKLTLSNRSSLAPLPPGADLTGLVQNWLQVSLNDAPAIRDLLSGWPQAHVVQIHQALATALARNALVQIVWIPGPAYAVEIGEVVHVDPTDPGITVIIMRSPTPTQSSTV